MRLARVLRLNVQICKRCMLEWCLDAREDTSPISIMGERMRRKGWWGDDVLLKMLDWNSEDSIWLRSRIEAFR